MLDYATKALYFHKLVPDLS